MKNKTSIRTKQVYGENDKVFLKKEKNGLFFEDHIVAEWFPTNFKWVPVQQ